MDKRRVRNSSSSSKERLTFGRHLDEGRVRQEGSRAVPVGGRVEVAVLG